MNGTAKLMLMGCLLLSIGAACLGGCSKPATGAPETSSARDAVKRTVSAPVPNAAKAAASEADAEVRTLSGKVVETMSVSNYSYVRLENNGKKEWAAIPLGKVEVGATMNLRPGMVMHDFHSKSLNRTFDRIVFSEGPVVTAQVHPETRTGRK
jgi:hypothetical protein